MLELWGFDTRVLYLLLLALVIGERLVELGLARRNLRWALAHGGVEAGRGHYPWMVLLHTLFLAGCAVEPWWPGRPFLPALGIPMLLLLLATMGLRYWAVRTLGERWTTRIVVVPGLKPVTGGPYRHLRHPNYLAVILEGFALPLIHTAWLTAVIFTAANAVLLTVRIRAEEAALERHGGYDEVLGDRPRLLPGVR